MKLPWRVKNDLERGRNALSHHLAVLRQRGSGHSAPPDALHVAFWIPEYAYTGGAAAIVQVANLLAPMAAVSFVTRPSGPLSRHLDWRVDRVTEVPPGAQFCVVESGIPLPELQRLKQAGMRIVVSNHGFPDAQGPSANHGYDPQQVQRAWDLADHLHVLSQEQAHALLGPQRLAAQDVWLIPNAVPPVPLAQRCARPVIGVVADTTRREKNVARTLELALQSRADSVQVWGRTHAKRREPRVTWHGFESDRRRIFSSFSVLLSLSLNETQPLTVAEAMSAGIPCVLSDLPCYRPALRALPGIWIVDPDQPLQVVEALHAAFALGEPERTDLQRYWQTHCAPQRVLGKWLAHFRIEQTQGLTAET